LNYQAENQVGFCLITQSSTVPIVCFDAMRRVFFMMTAHVKLDDRLSILRTGDRFRKWNSLDDQRVCSVCERKFKGRQVEIRRFAGGRYKMYCPTLGCPSPPNQWFYPQTLVVSEIGEPGCWRAGKQPAHRQVRSTLQPGCYRV
jgi:hypothetical protein